MSVTRDHLAEHVLDALIGGLRLGGEKGWPREAVLETAVNLLAYERGTAPMAATLEQLADTLRRGEVVEHGWVLAHSKQPA